MADVKCSGIMQERMLCDGFKCAECGETKELQVHHIKPWKNNKELRYVVSNGITLCRKCHLKAHGGNWKNDLSEGADIDG